MKPVASAVRGFKAPFEGLQIIFSSPKNIMFSIFPFVIGIVFFFLGTSWFMGWCQSTVDAWMTSLEFIKDWPGVGAVLNALVFGLLFIIVSLLGFLLSYVCISIVAGPFYALMVENLFKELAPARQRRGTFALAFNMFLLSLGKIFLFLFIGVVCLILSFIPILNLVAAFVAVLLVSFDCADFAFEIDFLTLRDRFRFVFKHFWEFSGLSVAIILTTLLPGSFFVLLPAFICGATKMYIQLSRETV